MKFALVGNQNCGKTTLFNRLTGARRHTGNFPGVTVDAMEGAVRGHAGYVVVDLPGIYSLNVCSAEEALTRDALAQGDIDGIINIVDATNLERNLYLTLQLLELQKPMVVAVNLMDALRGEGGALDTLSLSRALGVPVIPISAAKNENVGKLSDAAVQAVREGRVPPPVRLPPPGPGPDALVAGVLARYAFLESICALVLRLPNETHTHTRSRRLDDILTHRFFGLPIFLLIMLLIFRLTFGKMGTSLYTLTARGIDVVCQWAEQTLTGWGVGGLATDLVTNGVLAGLGNVLSFLPVILTLFFFLSLLEDTGYMARIAFVTDRPMRALGLSGRSIVPLLLGFGCTVPAVMATRTLPASRERRMTVLLTPFISCSAKIPLLVMFTTTLFPGRSAAVMTGLYLLALFTGALYARLCRTGNPEETINSFVLELPDYRLPSLKTTLMLLWEKARDFLRRAFTVIFAANLLIWFLCYFDGRLCPAATPSDSLLAGIGGFLAPLFAPLGFADWRAATALLSGLLAKEAVLSTLDILVDGQAVSALFTPASAISFLVFSLLYTPCVAAMATIRRELGSTWRALAVAAFQFALAWVWAAGALWLAMRFL